MKKLLSFFAMALVAVMLTSCCCNKGGEQKWKTSDVIYEVNIRQYTPEGTFNAFVAELPRLKELGVDIIWIMPVSPIGIEGRKGGLGSYYSIVDYTAVNPEFGTLDDFKTLVKKAHEVGLKVIIDWVANHTSRDAVWLQRGHKNWYIWDSATNEPGVKYDWTDIAQLDYTNEDMRAEMVKCMKFWLTEADIDGFRCDVASEVPTDFWNKAIPELRKVKDDIFMLAEAEEPSLMDKAFNMYYAWGLHFVTNEVAQGKKNVNAIRQEIARMMNDFPKSAIPMYFTSNHDENSWKGSEFERMSKGVEAFAALTYVLPGMPLIYSGQEAGFDRRLSFFEKDSINWHGVDANKWGIFYKNMNTCRKEHPALYSQPDGGSFREVMTSDPDNIYAFTRLAAGDTVICFFNFSDKEIPCAFACPRDGSDKMLPLKAWEYSITAYGKN
jgi:glycosidase